MGIREDEFVYRKPKRGLITKTEVRVISLSKMALREDSVVWDVGAGSGSVSIEAALIARRGRIYAIERGEEDIGLLKKNIEKFQIHNCTVIHGRAPEALTGLKAPDAVFIGGSGGAMGEIIEQCWKRLKLGGSLVINVATIENLYAAFSSLKKKGIPCETTLISIARSREMRKLTRFDALNPVFVISARK